MGVAGRPGAGDDPEAPQEPTPPPPRAPRPGDPFGTAAGAAPAPGPPRRRRRKGRTFFLFLLVTGGVLAVGTILVFFTFRNMTVEFYRDVVVPRGIPEALPPGYPREDAVRLVQALDTFFARADEGQIGDEAVIEVIARIESAMADRRITPEEAEALIATVETAGRKDAAPPAPASAPNGGEG